VLDPSLRQRVVDECLVPYLLDQRDAWTMDSNGTYRSVSTPPHGKRRGAQEALMKKHAAGAARAEPATDNRRAR